MLYINPDWSTINIYSKGTIRHIGDPADADMTEEEYRSAIGGMWHVVNNQNSRALIPETVAYRLIKLLTYRGDVVVAPYNKIGKVTLAAAKTGRRYLGIDAFDAYCDTANDLIAKIR